LTGTGASGALASFDASGNLRGSAVFEVAGQVGINDSSPSAELDVTGDTRLDGALTVTGSIDVGGDSTVTGDSGVDGAMTVTGHTQLDSTLTVAGDAQVDGALTVTGNVTGLSVSLTGCAWVEDDCETDGTELVYLDRANNLTCPSNQVLTDWNVENCGGGEFRMRFYCCSLTVQ
jgi:cytoskeletal protein CcmA (bactofilin family)